MSFDGSGNYTRIHNWTADAAAAIKIRADRHDAEDNSIATALNNCLLRDGQASIITNSQNNPTLFRVLNTNAGTAARARFEASNGTSIGVLDQLGTGFTPVGVDRANGTKIDANGVGGLTLNTSVDQPIYFGVNGIERARLTSAGFGIGMTPVNILDITQSVNSSARANILNANAGAATFSEFRTENGTSFGALRQNGANFTTSGVVRQNGTIVSASGVGGLTLNTTIDQPIYFAVNNTQTARWNADTLSIGVDQSNVTVPLWVRRDQDNFSSISVGNHSVGTAARADLFVTNGTASGSVGQFGTGFTTAGINRQNGTLLAGGGAGGVTVATTVNQPVYIAVNNAEVAQFTASGLHSNKKITAAVVTLTDGATVPLDASQGNTFKLVAAGNRTILTPSNPTNGQRIIIMHEASGLNRTLALTTGSAGAFRFGTDITGLTDTTNGLVDYIGAVYNLGDDRWDVVAYTKGF